MEKVRSGFHLVFRWFALPCLGPAFTSSRTHPDGYHSWDGTMTLSNRLAGYAVFQQATTEFRPNGEESWPKSNSRKCLRKGRTQERKVSCLKFCNGPICSRRRSGDALLSVWESRSSNSLAGLVSTIFELRLDNLLTISDAFIYYAPTLFSTLGADYEMSLILSGTLNIVQLLAVFICFFIIEKVGRRPLAIYGAIGMFVVYVIIAGLVGKYSSDWSANASAGWACVAMAFIYMLVYGVSYSPLAWALPSEVFSNATRSKGVAMSTATVWLSNFIIGVATPPMLDSAGFGTYLFFAAFCFLAIVWAYFLVPETKGKTLEEMDDVFGDAGGKMEKELMKHTAGRARRRSSTAGSL